MMLSNNDNVSNNFNYILRNNIYIYIYNLEIEYNNLHGCLQSCSSTVLTKLQKSKIYFSVMSLHFRLHNFGDRFFLNDMINELARRGNSHLLILVS